MNRLHFGIAFVTVAFGAISCSSPSAAQVQITATTSPSQESEYTLIGGECTKKNCLFTERAEPDFLIGLATVSGYYVQLERSAFEQTKWCDSFTIAEGPPALIQSLSSLVEHGNTVYTKNDLDQVI